MPARQPKTPLPHVIPALIQTVPHEVISVRPATDVLKNKISSSGSYWVLGLCERGGGVAPTQSSYFGPEIRQEDPPNLSI